MKMGQQLRIKVAAIILAAVALALVANLFIDDGTVSPVQLDQLRAACPTCHGLVPEYDTAITVHNMHASLNCSQCHNYVGGLEATDRVHAGLEWLGAGVAFFGLVSVVTNFLVVSRRVRAD